MDDNTTLRAEFTVADQKVTATQPTGEQLFVLQLTRQAQSAKEGVRTSRRLVAILETLLGTEQWDSVIEHGLINGTISVKQMMELAWAIFAHDWSAEAAGDALQHALDREEERQTADVTTMSTPLPTKTVVAYEDEIADALAAGE